MINLMSLLRNLKQLKGTSDKLPLKCVISLFNVDFNDHATFGLPF